MSSFIKALSVLALAFLFYVNDAKALTLGDVAQVAQTASPAAFNTIELVAAKQARSHVPQWSRAQTALETDVVTLQACLDNAAACPTEAMANWRLLVTGLRGYDEMTVFNAVNQFFNQLPYISDQENYGVSEYWASPLQFMQNGGDCEDFAIAKYVTLKFLGYGDQHLRIMAVIDNSRGGIGHAVLTVMSQEGKIVLDNQSTVAYNDAQQTAYAPRFAVNNSGVYTYASQPQILLASAE